MENLFKVALTVSILGVFLLLFISQSIQPKQINNQEELNQLKIEKRVKTNGTITSINTYNNFNVIKLDNGLTIICNDCNLSINQNIILEGKVAIYKNQSQIQANKIEVN